MSLESARDRGATGLSPLSFVATVRVGEGATAIGEDGVGEGGVARPVRNGTLRDILDEEFSRCYRFEGVSDLFHDIKHFWRRVVGRDGDEEGVDLESSLPKHN